MWKHRGEHRVVRGKSRPNDCKVHQRHVNWWSYIGETAVIIGSIAFLGLGRCQYMILNSIKYNKWEVPFKVIKLAIIIINKIYTVLCEKWIVSKEKHLLPFTSLRYGRV